MDSVYLYDLFDNGLNIMDTEYTEEIVLFIEQSYIKVVLVNDFSNMDNIKEFLEQIEFERRGSHTFYVQLQQDLSQEEIEEFNNLFLEEFKNKFKIELKERKD